MDSFTYTLLGGRQPGASATVLMLAKLHGQKTIVETFEEGDIGALTASSGAALSVGKDAALDGWLGLRIDASGTDAYERRRRQWRRPG